MKQWNQKILRWFTTAACAICWGYAAAARFTTFFMASRSEKAILLSATIIATSLLSIFIFQRIFPKIADALQLKTIVRAFALSLFAAAVLLLFVLPPLYFPEQHTLEIMPLPGKGPIAISLVGIQQIELPGNDLIFVPHTLLDLQGNWQIEGGVYPIRLTDDPQGKIRYTNLMQAGIRVILQTGPGQGQVLVIWDGEEYIHNLSAPTEGTQSLVLMPALNFLRADLTRKVLVGFAMITEFLGLSAIITIIFLVLKGLTVQHAKALLIAAFSLLALLPLVSIVDPPAEFPDPRLEAAIRVIIDQPGGTIRQHQLLTIAKLKLRNSGVTNLEGIQHLRKLVSLDLRDNSITDISPIKEMKGLVKLNLRNNAITDIAPLAGLNKLEYLNLRDNSIQDIEPLAGLTRLKYLNLRGNPVRDPSLISGLTHLQKLNLNGIPLGEGIAFLHNFPDLNRLNIRNCSVTDVSVLAALMAQGILQEGPTGGPYVSVDIRDNPIPRQPEDGYALLRPYWDQISLRAPFTLPIFNTLPSPSFSKPAGFYENDFLLTVSVQDPQAVIYYTLDGSEPTRESSVYTQPLLIASRAGQPNGISMIENTSKSWREPIGEVFKATVVRAVAIRPDGTHSAVATNTYFVDPDMPARYTLPIVSISTDPDNLFNDDYGIYMLTRNYRQDGILMSNFNLRGGEWERPVHIDYFDQSGMNLFSQDGGVRMHGSSLRGYPQKSLRLYADDSYSPSDYFQYGFFSNLRDAVQHQPITQFKTLLLRGSGNNSNYPIFRDTIMQVLLSDTKLDSFTYNPVLVFLNNEYWGLYNLRENLDEYYLAAHYRVEPQQVAIVERDAELNTGQTGDEDHYRAMLDHIRNHDIRIEENYEYIKTQMDTENFIDYLVAEIYAANSNWPADNRKYWRFKTETYQPDAPYGQDGRWRWLLFDLDTGFGYGQYGTQDDTLTRATGDFLIRTLLENDQFRDQFINRFADHLNTSLKPERVVSAIGQMQSKINPEMPEHIRRWNIMDNSMDVWNENVDVMRTFAHERPAIVRDDIVNYFGLDGTFQITLLAEPSQGIIRINSVDITADTAGVEVAGEWSGIYFRGVPITLSATPLPGYRFAGWEGIDRSDPVVKLSLSRDLILKANFTPIGD